MKVRLLTLLAVIFLLGNVSSAQGVGTFRAKKKSTIVKKNLAPQRQGTFIMPEVGVGIINFNEGINFNIQAVFGYEFNNHLALGVGTGFNNYNLNDHYYLDYYDRWLTMSIPLYINIHGDFSKHKTTAYYSLDLGVQMPIRKAIGFDYVYYKYYDEYGYYSFGSTIEMFKTFFRGFFISPEIGVRFNSCYLGVNYTCAKSHSRNDLSVAYNDDWFTHILSLKFGYKIPLKNVRF